MSRTIGDWELCGPDEDGDFLIMANDPYIPHAVATVHKAADEDGHGDTLSNAALLLAAPELLEAAEELKAAFLDGCGEATRGPKRQRLTEAGAALDVAIAKAKGGERCPA